MPYCRACGVEVKANTTYCPECGEELNFMTETAKGAETSNSLEHEPEPKPELDLESTSELEPEFDIEHNTASKSDSSLSIWAKIVAVLCVPIALVGFFLEIAAVYTVATGGYTLGEFGVASVLFGLMAFLPLAYLNRVYTQIQVTSREMV